MTVPHAAMVAYEAQRLLDRPDDRALHALGRPYSGCSLSSPCREHIADGARPIPYDWTTNQVDEALAPLRLKLQTVQTDAVSVPS